MFLQLAIDTQLQDEVDIFLVLKEGVQLQDGRMAETGVDGHFLPHPVDQPSGCDLALVNLEDKTTMVIIM